MKNQRGFGLLGNLLGIGVMMAVGAGVVMFKGDVEDYVTAQTRGGEYLTLLKAGEAYAKKNQTNIMLNNGSATMTPNIATLKAAGFLAQTYSSNAPIRFGGDLSVILKHEPVGCPGQSCVIQVSVVPTTSATKQDNRPNYKLATNIALAAGGYGWSTATDTDLFVAKNGKKILNPLGNVPAVAIAATWLPSNKPGSTDTHPEYQNLPCPSPQTGLITNTRNVWTDKWGGQGATPWVFFSSSCVMPPPTCANGASDYPTCTPPVAPTCANGATDYPTCTPPPVSCANGATNPPTCTLPPATCSNGATNPPTCTLPAPTCSNGATNPPTCTLPAPTCPNGATNPPTCTFPIPTCPNGATNPPTCTFPIPTCPNGATNPPTCTLKIMIVCGQDNPSDYAYYRSQGYDVSEATQDVWINIEPSITFHQGAYSSRRWMDNSSYTAPDPATAMQCYLEGH